MRKPGEIISEFKLNNKEEDSEKMDLLMKTIKVVHSASTASDAFNQDELNKQRAASEKFSKLVAPVVGLKREQFSVGEIPCEWFRPVMAHRSDRIILYCHGGGYVNGGLGYAGILGGKLSQHTGLEVLTFAYRLSPEHPYPAAIEDAVAVWDYLLHLGYGASNIIVAGDSAGGNLALELCFVLKEKLRFLPAGLVLMSPWTDMRATNNSYKTYEDKDPMLTYKYVIAARNAYTGEKTDAVDFASPEFSPLLGDFDKMPPALIQVGSNEILRDDSERLYKKYTKAGNMAILEVCPGGWHVYQQMPIQKAWHALESINTFISRL